MIPWMEQGLALLLSFSLQLLAAELLYTSFLKRRSHFVLRLILAGGLFLLGTYNMPFYQLEGLPSYRFLLTFALSVPVLWFCFGGSFSAILFCAGAGFASRTLVMNLVALLEEHVFKGIPIYMIDGYPYSLLYGLFVPAYVILYLTVARRLKDHPIAIENRRLIAVTLAIVCLNEMMNAGWWSLHWTDLVPTVYGILCCALVLLLQFQFFREKELKNQTVLLEQLLAKEREKYEISRQNIELVNVKAHDLKHTLSVLKKAADKPVIHQLYRTLEESVSRYDDVPNTGHIALDTILQEKQPQFHSAHIEFSCFADGKLLRLLEDADIYTLFGNILSNAQEREEQEPEDKRFISLTVSNKANCLYIHVDNYCSGMVRFENGVPQTSGDPNFHGFGTKSIQYIVNKYGGLVRYSCEEMRFSVDILIPLAPAAAGSESA